MGSIFYQGSGIKILGKKGLRDQNNGKKIGIGGSRIYHVTTLHFGGLCTLHSFNEFIKHLDINQSEHGFLIFHTNIRSIRRNIDNVQTHLDELDFQFSVLGLTETKISYYANSDQNIPQLKGYNFMSQHHWHLEVLVCILVTL